MKGTIIRPGACFALGLALWAAPAAGVHWTGAGGDNRWSTAANWDSFPAYGDQVVFQSGAAQLNNQFDIPDDRKVGQILFASGGTGYTIGSQNVNTHPIRMIVGVLAHSGPVSDNAIVAPLTFYGSGTDANIWVDEGSLAMTGEITLPSTLGGTWQSLVVRVAAASRLSLFRVAGLGDVHVSGAGTTTFTGTSDFLGNLSTGDSASGSIVVLDANARLNIQGSSSRVTVSSGGLRLSEKSGIHFIDNTSSQTLFVSHGAALVVSGTGGLASRAILADGLSMAAKATGQTQARLVIAMNDPGDYVPLEVRQFLLQGAQLDVQLSAATSTGQSYPLVVRLNAPSSSLPNDAFDGLPEGGTFDGANGRRYQITYRGGALGRDIVITDVGPTPQVPGPPTGVTATALVGAVRVGFAPPASDGGSAVLDYRVSCGAGVPPVAGSGSPITVSGLASGTPYGCTVAARNAVGLGPESAPASATTPAPPGPPTGVTTDPLAGLIRIGFLPPSTDGASPILDYRATCNPGNLTAKGGGSPILVVVSDDATPYSCTVAARNGVGFGPESAPAVTPLRGAEIPSLGRTGLGVLAILLALVGVGALGLAPPVRE